LQNKEDEKKEEMWKALESLKHRGISRKKTKEKMDRGVGKVYLGQKEMGHHIFLWLHFFSLTKNKFNHVKSGFIPKQGNPNVCLIMGAKSFKCY
jgi:hypothetical protein